MKRARFVRAYEKGDENEIFELVKVVWGGKVPTKERWAKGWSWMNIDNPAGASIIWLAPHDSMLVGQYPLVMENIKIGEKIVMGAQIADTMTHPEYRRQGIAFVLGKKALSQLRNEDGACVIGFPTPQAYKLHMKSGWIDICAFQIMVKPLNINSIFRSYLPHNKVLLKISTGIGSLILKILTMNEKSSRDDELMVTKISYFDDRFDNFWKRISNDYDIIIVRNKEYLNWRYVDVPNTDYSIYVAEKKKEICGYVVLGCYKRGDLMLGFIYDIIAPLNQEEVLHCLMSKAVDHFREEKVDAIFSEMVVPKIYRRIFIKNGFIPHFMSKSRFIVYSASHNISQTVLKNPKNWFVQLGDLPMVY
jgi:GNAT superfamily N-acetyltransferase